MAFVDVGLVEDSVHAVPIGSLAVLRPLLEALNVAAIFDRHLPTEAEIPHGKVLAILLAARLQEPLALVNLQQWAREHGTEYLWDVPADKLNDDRFARALDAFADKRHDILADITQAVLRLAETSLDRLHFDTTHLVFYGAYYTSEPRPATPLEPIDRLIETIRESPAHITRGYQSRYKMLQFGLTCAVDELGALPVCAHVFDGNRNGHTGIAQQYQLLRDSLDLPDGMLFSSDRGTCSAEHLGRLLRHGHHALCAGQWQDYRPLYEEHAARIASLTWAKASYLSMEQQRRHASRETSTRTGGTSLPLDDYRLAVVDHELTDPATKDPFACRVIFVHSSAGEREARERRDKNVAKIRAGLDALAVKLERGHPATTPHSVHRQIERLFGQKARKAAARHFRCELVPLTEAESAALPAPAKGHRRQTHRLTYVFDEASVQAETRHDGISALVTTAPKTPWSADALFTQYKRQIHVERSHHEFKTPIAVNPIFLKKPERVESLASLLFVALQAAMTLERLYRRRVPETAPLLERRMTFERILRIFRPCGLIVTRRSYGDAVRADRLTPEQRRILSQLSLATPTEILLRTMARAPTS
jgi:transposase